MWGWGEGEHGVEEALHISISIGRVRWHIMHFFLVNSKQLKSSSTKS